MEKLTAAQKKTLAAQIQKLDPKGEIVALSPNSDFTGGTIVYQKDSGLILGENGFRLKDEEYVRAWLVVRLIRLFKYPADCFDIEHTYVQGHPSPTSAQIDIRVHDKRGKKRQTFMIIEAKCPDKYDTYTNLIDGQLFATGQREHANGLRYAVWHTVEFRGDVPHDKCIIIDFRKFTESKEWIEAGEPGHNLELPSEYGVVRKPKFVKGKTDLRTDLTRADFTALQKDFHNQLWGGGGSSDSDVFVNLLKILLAKIYDEKTKDEGEAYDFQIELKDGSPEPAEEIFAKVNRIYRDALRHYFKYDEDALRSAAISKEKLKPEKVAFIVERLESISIIENACDDDVLGAFFEAIVRDGFRQGKGQFFTHTNIARFVLYALELDTWAIEYIHCPDHRLPFIIDPSDGSGTFLIEAMKVITDAVLRRHSKSVKKSDIVSLFLMANFFPTETSKNAHNRWAKEFVYGIEDSEDLAMATKVNMILHGDGNANIQKGDGLADFRAYERDKLRNFHEGGNHPYKYPRNEEFDCVVSNPPFSLKEDTRTLAQRITRFAYADRKNSENLFIERYYQLLKPGGRMGVVLPDSVFDTNENLYIRLFLYRFFFIKAVVSLPQIAFQPYTPTKTSLLFAVKKKPAEVAAWDAAWREATNEYGKLRKSSVIAHILTNDRLRSGLIDLANRSEVEWYPAANLLTAASLPAGIRAQLTDACADSAGQKKKLAGLLAEFDKFTAADALGKFSTAQEKEARATIARLLRDRLTPIIAKLKFHELIESAYDDIVEAADLNHTEDPRGQNYCNAWWCFAEVTSKDAFDYPIFFAEAGHVGYKRTTRHPEGIEQPNDLFRTDAEGNIVIDTENPQTILDHLRARRFFFWNPKSLDEAAGIRSYHAKLADCRASFSLRFSARYLHPRFRFLAGRVLGAIPTTTLGKLVVRSIETGVQPDYADGGVPVVKIGTMQRGHFDWSDVQYVDESFHAKYQRRAGIRKRDILISSTGVGSLGKVDIWDTDKPALATVDVNIVRIAAERAAPELLAHLLRHRVVQWQIDRELAGSTNQIHIYGHQLARLCLPSFPPDAAAQLLAKMSRIESDIATARAALRAPDDVIDEILCAEFGYPLAEHRERARLRHFARTLGTMAAGFTLRNSAKFHHPDFELTERFFARTPHERVKAFVAVPIRLGATATKGDLIEEGDAYYVHPGATKKQRAIALDDCHQVTQKFYDAHQRRFGLRPGDVIINRSGEALGKVAIFEHDDEPALASDFTMRVRFNKDRMNPRFAWFFFRSVMFQAQVLRELRGSSVPNIFPPQVERMHVVTCARPRQNELAAQITTALAALDTHRAAIESKRKEIDALIDAAIAQSPIL